MSGVQHIKVTNDEAGMRLDRWIRIRFPQLKQGRLQKILRTGQVRVDGGRAKAAQRLEAGQTVRLPPLDSAPERERFVGPLSESDEEFIHSLILHMDKDVIVLNKPPGIPVQGGSKIERHIDGFLDALMFEAKERPRLVHRLDRDTSGVLLLARRRKIASDLGKVFRTRSARKIYWALVHGVPRPMQGKIDAALLKYAGGPEGDRMHVVDENEEGAQRASTYYSVTGRAGETLSWLSLKPVTGRTHQIRVHLDHIGHGVVGDRKYRNPELETGAYIPEGMQLHARRLTLPHPSGGTLDITAPLPPHMAAAWKYLEFDTGDAPGGEEFPNE
ncbi:MAG: RluA family pseudouridine synthase [Rhizobiales bacterium]|nr:RluA family pseudouridine synthase [Hyphomicrobiales bacterium]